MAEAIKVFISYRNVELSKVIGGNLYRDLKQQKFDVFFDQTGLKRDGGVEWEEVLETNVRTCHVLLVLVQPETSQSAWVKREIDAARQTFAAVIPIVVVEDTSKISQALTELDLDGLQFLSYHTQTLDIIVEAIQARSAEVIERRTREAAWENEETARFKLRGVADCPLIELVIGDATTIPGYEVLVNSENTYMQMARYFESNTLSCTIRHKGSHIVGGFIVEDTVQDQLSRQLKLSPEYPGTPIRTLEVLITEAGHPDSELAQMDFRYIFHAATVTVDRYSQRIDSLPALAIPDVITNCLRKLDAVNAAQGSVLFVERGKKEGPRSDYQPLTSILFPLFGTGHGGNQHLEVAGKIIEGFRNTIRKRKPASQLPKMGLCVYNPDHAEPIARTFIAQGFVRI